MPNYSIHQCSLVLSQKLWDSGQTRAQVRQSIAGVRSLQAGVGVARETVAFNVATSYFEQLRNEKLFTLAKRQVEQAQQHLERIKTQVEAGVSARTDLQPVQVELRQAQVNLVSAESNDRVAATQFRNALGLPRGPRLKLQEVTAVIPDSSGRLEDYLAEAARSRSELQQAKASVEAKAASHDLAKIQSRPLATLNAYYNLGLFDSPLERERMVDGVLTIPLFNAGALRAQVVGLEGGSGGVPPLSGPSPAAARRDLCGGGEGIWRPWRIVVVHSSES